MYRTIVLSLGFLVASMSTDAISAVEVDMRPYWDDQMPLENPHKGWYHHFPDNHIDKYRIASDADLLEFPGMDHLYLRLAWSYLEPTEGEYRWEVFDEKCQLSWNCSTTAL
jgi:hypothetical protein